MLGGTRSALRLPCRFAQPLKMMGVSSSRQPAPRRAVTVIQARRAEQWLTTSAFREDTLSGPGLRHSHGGPPWPWVTRQLAACAILLEARHSRTWPSCFSFVMSTHPFRNRTTTQRPLPTSFTAASYRRLFGSSPTATSTAARRNHYPRTARRIPRTAVPLASARGNVLQRVPCRPTGRCTRLAPLAGELQG